MEHNKDFQEHRNRVHEETLETMEDVIQHLCPFKKKISKLFGINSTFIFRGVSDHNYQLQPSLYRGFEKKSHNRDVLLEELRLLKDFVEACDLSGTQIPADSYKLRIEINSDNTIFNRMMKEQSSWLVDGTLNEIIGLAQHYGVPTRFLDWSYQPLVALYFASIGAIKKMNNDLDKDYSDSYIAVWAYLPTNHSRVKVVDLPRSINSHISYQQGCFTFIIQDRDRFSPINRSDNDRSKTLFMDTYLRQDDLTNNIILAPKTLLVKLKIPYSLVTEIYKYCDAYSFNAATLFRGPHGSAEYTNEKRIMHKVEYDLNLKKKGLKPITL
ncbi:FRG domain-containing protein [Acinetobacter nectaris]|uniref:FRG domain-containing protein n=1 Tax=Acinetobacter nectaris TaxID=1219382 RepID=UPI001F38B640|nr:FRG domain-containing protein [Acinetobacter nectaris]MCF9034715.1 FRG domain-containing protein [Acinetobacter nectaris]